MVTGAVIGGRMELGVMVHTWVVSSQLGSLLGPLLEMRKCISSAPEVPLACWIAALKVHSPAIAVWHTPSPWFASSASPVELTVKVVAAWAGFAACKPNNNTTASIIVAPKAKAVALPIRIVSKKKLVLIRLFLS